MYPVRTSLVLADDSPVYRCGLMRRILLEQRIELVSVVDDGDAALDAITNLRPDVALLDVRMPGRSGLQVCAAAVLEGAAPHTRIVLMSAHADEELVTRGHEVGAASVLSKALPRQEILAAILASAATQRVTHAA